MCTKNLKIFFHNDTFFEPQGLYCKMFTNQSFSLFEINFNEKNSSTDKKDVIGTDEGILQSNKELNEIRLKSECYLSLDIGTAGRVYARLLIFQDFPPGKL